jgi:phenylpropionate dioxygenase-like ring-hydroxylating dioxygenase large terminal subunit
MNERDSGGPQVRWPREFNVLPKEVFHRRDVYEKELDRIFYGEDWHPIAHRAEVPNPGDFKTLFIGEAPVLILHGSDGQIRVFYNSCPHRGTMLQTHTRGTTKKLECPYHRWQFSDMGKLTGVTGTEDFPPDFRKEDYGLRQIRSEEVFGLVFATCSDTASGLDHFLGEAKEYLGRAFFGDGRLRLIGYQKTMFATNWKEYGDNEGYHPPLLHRAFRLLRWQGGKGVNGVTVFGHRFVDAELSSPPTGFLNDQSLVEFKDAKAPRRSIITSFWPMTTIVKHMDVVNVRYAFPKSPDETECHYAYFGHADDDEATTRHRVRQASNLLGPSGFISLEDGAVFNRVHQGSYGLGTVAYQKGFSGTPIRAPYSGKQNDEAQNLVRWERYRNIMGFERG